MCRGEEGRCKGLADETVLTCCVAVVNAVGASIRDFCASNVAKLQKTEKHYKDGGLIFWKHLCGHAAAHRPVYRMGIYPRGLEASVMCKSSCNALSCPYFDE